MDNLRDETWKNLQQSMDAHERAHKTLIGKFFAALEDALKQRPSHSAIPEEVRNAMLIGLDAYDHRNAQTMCRDAYESVFSVIEAARAWLAQCPTATATNNDQKEVPSIFHALWTKAVGTPTYDKAEWRELEREIIQRSHKCTTATDKAVCPQCGSPATVGINNNKEWVGYCWGDCKRGERTFPVKVLVISPPRAPKVECPGPDCSLCNGSACDKCGAGCWSNEKNCQHDVVERHEHTPRAPKVTG